MNRNVLLITCDQLRADTLGCCGNSVIRTPKIDTLADRGTNFTKMFVAYPICAPNRGTLATGRYPSVHGLRQNGMALPKRELTFMEVLRQKGYATAAAGKMHFGPQWRFGDDPRSLRDPGATLAINPQPAPTEMPWHGFTEAWITEDHRVGPYADYLKELGYDPWADPHSFSYPQHQTVRSAFPAKHHQTTWITDRSIDFLRKQTGERPFLLWTSFVAPHHPFVVPAPYDTMYNPEGMPLPHFDEKEPERWPEKYLHKYLRTEGSHEAIGMNRLSDHEWQRIRAYYYGSITHIDEEVGRLLGALEEKGMMEDTVIVFTSDHGEMLGDHHLLFKGTTYDEVTRVPFIVAEPGGRQSVCDSLCCSIDVMPTLLDLAGVGIPASVQGKSLEPCLRSPGTTVRDCVLIETQFPDVRALRTDSELFSWHGPNRQGELYDLDDDPFAQRNLWDMPKADRLQKRLLDIMVLEMAANTDPLPKKEGFC